MRFHWTPTQRHQHLLLATIGGLLCGLALTPHLWTGSERSYPLAPIIDGFTLSPLTTDLLLGIIILGFATALVWQKARATLILVGLVALGTLVLADITRLQPWVFHYGTILGLCAYTLVRRTPASTLLDAIRILVAGIYFWSGVQKMNLAFVGGIFPWFTEPLWSPFGEIGLYTALTLGVFVPFLEAAFGLGLLFARTRTISLYAAGGMLLVVLASLGPFGHDWNSSVWPWNIALFATAFILFFRTDFTFMSFWTRTRRSLTAWLAIGLFWLMPIGSFFGVVDHYLAWSLYSGTVPEAAITGPPETLGDISAIAQDEKLSLIEWVHDDLNVVPYPEERVFVNIFAWVCQHYPEEAITLTISQYRKDTLTYVCSDF